MVPSSTTVTPLAATCWPIRPAKADVCLRFKSPSSPWPTASCSITPGQPGPSTTSISPAGAGTASRLTSAWRTASLTACCQRADVAVAFAVGAQNLDHLPGGTERDRDLPHARVLGTRIGVDRLEETHLG